VEEALDPIPTLKIKELKKKYTIAIVTHNLQQAKRVADRTAFLYVDRSQGGRTGYLVEHGLTRELFENPREKHTREYIAGAFG
jgi:phosphate transport system ATP-binding protein